MIKKKKKTALHKERNRGDFERLILQQILYI